MAIFFHNEDREHPLDPTDHVSSWLEKVCLYEKKELIELNYVFCSDDYLLAMNKQYLQHNYYTDVISFDNSENENSIVGDIFISLDRVKDNALEHKVTDKYELMRVMVHGLLHLIGFDDKKEDDKRQMTQKEDTYLSLLPK